VSNEALHFESHTELASAISGLLWPAVPSPAGAAVLALLFQLDRSQWLAAESLRELQGRQLESLLRHAALTVPYYRERWAGIGIANFFKLPILKRADLQENFESLKSTELPRSHGAAVQTSTSGSTGAPVHVLKTGLTQLFWRAFTLRDHLWQRRDFSGKLATIRHGISSGEHRNWGGATGDLIKTGAVALLHIGADIDEQLRWLALHRPAYLMTYPSNVAELASSALAQGIKLPGLRQVRTLGEVLTPEVRELCRVAWDVPVTDVYSSDEIGYLALQCPAGDEYHVQSEGVLLEVLDEEDRPCLPGQVGRVVVTDLHNFATPLVRYELGDYAEPGASCACGRGLPVLRRIMGRTRNILLAPDGKRYWPFFGTRSFAKIAPVLQQQFVQKSRDLVEARLVTAAPLTQEQEQELRSHIASRLPPGFSVTITRIAEIPRSAGGKFEDFISEVTVPPRPSGRG